ncbi:MAG TPA: division plane positioning ATPase MipZ [Xanthobacteraceae bacterium]|nr:division plane positioning ATPase MipZ [Xanthobacteraceae bacterium]
MVIGNHKGGSGKSTLAMHMIIALLKAGRRVASIDLDFQQRTLTRYIENRREWAQQNNVELEIPKHRCIETLYSDDADRNDSAHVTILTAALTALQSDFDFVIIDTPGGSGYLSRIAHAMADTLVTPVNDSFVDLDVLFSMGPSSEFPPARARYAQTVAMAAEARRTLTKVHTDWIVVRNRMSPLATRSGRQIARALELMAEQGGFRTAPGLLERVVYREFFPVGLTAFDPLQEALLGVKPNISHLMARQEVRDLVARIGLLAPNEQTIQHGPTEADESNDPDLGHSPFSEIAVAR